MKPYDPLKEKAARHEATPHETENPYTRTIPPDEGGKQAHTPKHKPGSAGDEYGFAGNGEGEHEPEPSEHEEPERVRVVPKWPQPPAEAAFYGLAGHVVRMIEPHTEADPVAVLSMFHASFGNMIGPSAHFVAQSQKHPARIWPVLVGETAKGRKGSAWSSLRFVLNRVDEGWVKSCVTSGLSSGEGLIWAVRDKVVKEKRDKEGEVHEVVEDEGVSDKRILTVEEEFSAVLKVAAREGNTISDILRKAWDSGNIRSLVKNSPNRVTGAHVTVIGHITKADLSRHLTETDSLNGFGNRPLWIVVRRSKLLPDGGALHTHDMDSLILKLRNAVDFARKTTLVERSEEARTLWHERYPVLSEGLNGLLGGLTNRAEAQVMRLALIYALLDCSPKIEVVHLQAAFAFWDFCLESTRYIFGESLGDKLADRLLDAIREAGNEGLTRNAMRGMLGKNLLASRIDAALEMLERLKLAFSSKVATAGLGRPSTVWKVTPTI